MKDPERNPLLPRVEERDLLKLVAEEVLDPAHVTWWKEFTKDNPFLAREVIKRAYFDSISLSNSEAPPSTMEVQKTIVDAVSFALSALRSAAQRQREEVEIIINPEPEIDGVV